MADEVSSADDQPSAPDAQRAARPAPGRSDKLPLFGLLGRNPSDRRSGSLGFVGVVIVGALALVIALIAITIAIGRAPQEAPVAATPDSATPTATAQVSYTSPEPTGTRWTPEPIITGVPQQEPSWDPTPTPTPSKEDDEKDDEETPKPTATSEPEQTVIGRPGRGPAVTAGGGNQGNDNP